MATITESELKKIIELSETDEGLADLLLQIKEFYILKYPELVKEDYDTRSLREMIREALENMKNAATGPTDHTGPR